MKVYKKTRKVGNGHSREGDFSKLVLTSDNERRGMVPNINHKYYTQINK